MKKIITLVAIAIAMFTINTADLTSGPVKPPLGYTGAPGEAYCTDCHTGTPVNGGPGNIALAFSGAGNKYIPGKQYTVTVTVTDASQTPLCCFESTTLKSDNTPAGTYKVITPENTLIRKDPSTGRTYMSNYQSPNDYHQWSYKWKAPASNSGPITIYATGNASNDDFTPQGDHIYSTTLTLQPKNPLKMDAFAEIEEAFSVYPTLVHQQLTAGYTLQDNGVVQINLYSMQGTLKETLFNADQEAGTHQQALTISQQYAPGIYLCVMQQGEQREVKKIMIQ